MNCNTVQRLVARGITVVDHPGSIRATPGRVFLAFVAIGALTLSSCKQQPQQQQAPREPSLGVTYAGPMTLILRKDLSSRSATMTTVHHGEPLDILETRRRFVRVRAADGSQGWTDANLLMSEEQMAGLKQLAARAAALPSEGSAKVIEPLNVHTEPARLSPSVYQIAEGGSVDVVGHKVALMHAPAPAASNLVRRTPDTKKVRAKKGKEPPLILPPSPAGPPANWQELSRPRASDLPGYVAPEIAPQPTEDWSLVRMPDGNAGWVLSRMLFMAVPDEIAQYAEGHRITAYLALGETKDGDQTRQNWLWTTIAPGNKCCEFDSFRVFVWSIKHHRYETAFVERNVSGFYPVQLISVPGSQDKGFSLVVRDNKDGQLYKRTYAFASYHVRMVSREPAAPLAEASAPPKMSSAPLPSVPAKRSLWASLTSRVKQLWQRGEDR